ncbi:hypothetical protein EHS43_37950 [Streptomyces sp. RP5T]|nr:hypothetical protein EHS43_37950 [Streptomyces sp. RP5T]
MTCRFSCAAQNAGHVGATPARHGASRPQRAQGRPAPPGTASLVRSATRPGDPHVGRPAGAPSEPRPPRARGVRAAGPERGVRDHGPGSRPLGVAGRPRASRGVTMSEMTGDRAWRTASGDD